MRSAARTSALILAAAGATALVAGCGYGTPTASESSDSPTPSAASPSPSPTATFGAAASPSPTGTVAAGAAQPDRCHTGGLTIRSRELGAAAGNHYAVITLTNTSQRTCRVYGYPGLQLLDARSGAVPTKVVRDASSTPELITLDPQAASFTELHWGAVPGTGDNSTGPCSRAPAKTEVTPPDETAHQVITWSFGIVCERGTITVTSMRPGAGPTQ